MANRQTNTALGQLRKLLATQRDSRLADAQLLARFLAERDEAAFAALVRRHSAMVLGVCQSVLRQSQDAEDACQATFLVLAKKAGSIRKQTSVASWLHGVAYRLAKKLESSNKRPPENTTAKSEPASPMDELSWREVRQAVHEELERLPMKYRQPLILCYLEGHTQEEAARHLGWTAGMLKGMLTRGRDLLRQRLTRRGLALTAPLFAGALSPATANAFFAKATAHAAVLSLSGKTFGAGVSAQAIALAQGGLNGMVVTKLKVGAALLLTMCALAGGAGLASFKVGDANPSNSPPPDSAKQVQTLKQKQEPAKGKDGPRLDAYGDPLPPGAIARIGTSRLLQIAHKAKNPLIFSADGKQLVSNEVLQAIFWDPATGKAARRIAAEKQCFSLDLSPDGKTLAAAEGSVPIVRIRIIDLTTENVIHEIPFPLAPDFSEGPPTISFSADGKILAVQQNNRTIHLWETATWRKKAVIPVAKGGDAQFLSPREILIVEPEGLRWWDIYEERESRYLAKKNPQIGQFTISPDGKRAAFTASTERVADPIRIYLIDSQTGKDIAQFIMEKPKGIVSQHHQGLCFSPSSDTLASYCIRVDGANTLFFRSRFWSEIVFYSSDTLKEVRRWEKLEPVSTMTYSPNGKVIALLHDGSIIDTRDSETGKQILDVQRLPAILSARFIANSKTVIAGFSDGRIASWEARSGKQQGTFLSPPEGLEFPIESKWRPAFSLDGKRAAMVDGDSSVRVWTTATGETICRLQGVAASRPEPLFSPDGKFLVYGKKDKGLGLWDAETGRYITSIPANSYGRVFSPDSRCLATYGHEPEIHLWEIPSGTAIGKLSTQRGPEAVGCAFSPDGKQLISAHDNYDMFDHQQTLRVWELSSGKELRHFRSSGDKLFWNQMTFEVSPDGKTLARVLGTEVLLLELTSGSERVSFSGHKGMPTSLGFSPNGRHLISAANDHTALVWDITGISPDGKLIERNLPPEEIKRLWTELADADGVKAYRAMWNFVAAGKQAVSFFAEQLPRVKQVDEAQVARLIADLDNGQYKVRTQATKELQQIVELAEPALQKALAGNPTPETRQRLVLILDESRNRRFSAEQLQILRAIEALENMATPEARRLLESLAGGAAGALQTKEAKASLERLAKIPSQ